MLKLKPMTWLEMILHQVQENPNLKDPRTHWIYTPIHHLTGPHITNILNLIVSRKDHGPPNPALPITFMQAKPPPSDCTWEIWVAHRPELPMLLEDAKYRAATGHPELAVIPEEFLQKAPRELTSCEIDYDGTFTDAESSSLRSHAALCRWQDLTRPEREK